MKADTHSRSIHSDFIDIENLQLVKKEANSEDSVVHVNGIEIGAKEVVIMAGPCAVESEEQLLKIAKRVKASGAVILRGGAYKPRTSPYSFQGLKEEGLKILSTVREETGLPVITEVMDVRHIDLIYKHTDIFQIGSRNMHCFTLLEEIGLTDKPVLLKRGMSATIKEFLFAAEYIMKQGNQKVILCERGIRTFETATRNTLDLNAVPVLKYLTHLPVIVDPSHGTGHWWMVPTMAKAAIAAGADGLLIEVHHLPARALSDGVQSITPETFTDLMDQIKKIAVATGRTLSL